MIRGGRYQNCSTLYCVLHLCIVISVNVKMLKTDLYSAIKSEDSEALIRDILTSGIGPVVLA